MSDEDSNQRSFSDFDSRKNNDKTGDRPQNSDPPDTQNPAKFFEWLKQHGTAEIPVENVLAELVEEALYNENVYEAISAQKAISII